MTEVDLSKITLPARKVSEIIVHCSATRPDWMDNATPQERVEEIRRWHMQERKWSDIGYHFLIDRSGLVLQGRPLHREGAHTIGHNTGSIGVCLFGGFGSSADQNFGENFNAAQGAALLSVLARFADLIPGLKVSGHNQYAAKACPGFNAADFWADHMPDRLRPRPAPLLEVVQPYYRRMSR